MVQWRTNPDLECGSLYDSFEITPDFSTVYERLVNAVLGEEQNGDVELDNNVEREATDAPVTEPESLEDGDKA